MADPREPHELSVSPVSNLEPDQEPSAPSPGTVLCLSGGGYRAMIFHLGVLWRLNEAGILRKIDRISSVSGGSIIAGLLGLRWKDLDFDEAGVARRFHPLIVDPIRRFADQTIDIWAVLVGLLPFFTISGRVNAAYRKHLFGKATLQDLPDDADGPRFVINATNVQTAALWRFMKPAMRDYHVGEVLAPLVPLATAVGASSAFPPFLSPATLDLRGMAVLPSKGADLNRWPYTARAVLSDGGVYDNLGLETAWKRYQTVLVSDAGAKILPETRPAHFWPFHTYRVMNILDDQVRSLRKRLLIASYKAAKTDAVHRFGTYWGIRTNYADYPGDKPFSFPVNETLKLAAIPTRLAKMKSPEQEQLINWGYGVCDAAIRAYVDPSLPVPQGLPYPP